MTEVAFHFNVPDKVAYLCRLLRKVVQAQRRAVVCAPPDLLARLDTALWAFSAEDFITHATLQDPAPMQRRSSVLLADTDGQGSGNDVLVNCQADVPGGYPGYNRLIEVVGLDEADRALARNRWKHYVAAGITPLRHDIAVKGA